MTQTLPLPPPAAVRPLTVVLIGNPNTGKSTLFNALSGMQARVGNFPGVTVEKKVGRFQHGGRDVTLVDLPGTYSLSPRSMDEMVSVDVLLGRQADVGRPDAVVCIADASNLERNLYLFSQIRDLDIPIVLVLNMWDLAGKRGLDIRLSALQERLGVPIITTSAHRRHGIAELRDAVVQAAASPRPRGERIFPEAFYTECAALERWLTEHDVPPLPGYLHARILLDVGGESEHQFTRTSHADLPAYLVEARQRLAEAGCRVPASETRLRYGWIRERLEGVVTRPAAGFAVTPSDRIDRLLTHRIWGMAVFALLMFVVFQTIYRWAGPFMEAIESLQGAAIAAVAAVLPPGILRSLIADGVIAGVGSVLVFLPQIAFLFLFIALMEDCGYMARAAFVMDKAMTKLGLSGKSFVPLMSSFACAIPGIMATRVIENRRDRMVTILVAPLMSCSARLPVYLLLTTAFVPAATYLSGSVSLHGLVLFGMHLVGLLVAIPVAWLLKKTLFKGETPPFVMELPAYKWPSPRIVFDRVYDRVRAFVVRAGTLIFATSIVIWGAGNFPGDRGSVYETESRIETFQAEHGEELAAKEARRDTFLATAQALDEAIANPAAIDREEFARALNALGDPRLAVPSRGAGLDADTLAALRQSVEAPRAEAQQEVDALQAVIDPLLEDERRQKAALLEGSLLGRLGHAIEPAVQPLGWDWKIGVGAIASFPAREVIISTLGTIYSLGGEVSEEDPGLIAALQSARHPDGRPVYNVPVALSIMVFFALCAQCAATLMVIRRETNSWRWPALTFAYMTALAYVAALVTYQIGMRIG